MEAVLAFLGGGAVGALISQLGSLGRNLLDTRVRRRSYARMLHEDFLRQQSTVARAWYRGTDEQPAWWERAEFLKPIATREMYGDLLGALRSERYIAVASALGWMDYLRRACEAGQPPRPREELLETYRRLGTARLALTKFADFDYREHNHAQMRGEREPSELLDFTHEVAERTLAGLRSGGRKSDRPVPDSDA